MDNTKPDYPAMLKMASDFGGDFQLRLTDKLKGEFGKSLPQEAGVSKLAFKITDTELLKLIPECMKTDKRQAQNRGPVNDLWDRGVTMPTYDAEMNPAVRKYAVSWWSGLRLSLVTEPNWPLQRTGVAVRPSLLESGEQHRRRSARR